MKKEKKSPLPPPQERPMNPMKTFPTDPMGSYTGQPLLFPDEVPVQDADDL